MFFKKVHGLSELRFKNSTIFLYVKTEKKTVWKRSSCLPCNAFFIFTHWVYTVGYATYIFWCFFFRGIGIHHDNEPPVSNQVSMSNLRGCQVSIQPVHNSRKPSLRESGTQFFGGSSCWRCAALNGMVGGFSIGCLEWPDCWNTKTIWLVSQSFRTFSVILFCCSPMKRWSHQLPFQVGS